MFWVGAMYSETDAIEGGELCTCACLRFSMAFGHEIVCFSANRYTLDSE